MMMRNYLTNTFSSASMWPSDGLQEASYWESLVSSLGVEVINLIKVRDDGRSVLIVNHPSRGRCVLKGSSPVRNPRQGHANEALARRISSADAGIFPDVYEISPTYTLEEYVDGVPFRSWLRETRDFTPVKEYFTKFKEWSLSGAQDPANSSMSADDVRFVTRQYVDKCFSHYRYRPLLGKIKAMIAVRRRRRAFTGKMNALWSRAADLNLSPALGCGDMGTSNIIVEKSTGQLHNIDYESMGAGHWGFDAAYFVSSVCKNDPSPARRSQFVELVLTDEYLGGPVSGSYFRSLADLLIEIRQTITGASH